MSLKTKPSLRNPSSGTFVAPSSSNASSVNGHHGTMKMPSSSAGVSSSMHSLQNHHNGHSAVGSGGYPSASNISPPRGQQPQRSGSGGGGGPPTSPPIIASHMLPPPTVPSTRRVILLMVASFIAIILLLFGGSSSGSTSSNSAIFSAASSNDLLNGGGNSRRGAGRTPQQQNQQPQHQQPPPITETTLSPEVVARRKAREAHKAALKGQIGHNEARIAADASALAADRLNAGAGGKRQSSSNGVVVGGEDSSGDSESGSGSSNLHFAQFEDVDNIVFSCFYLNDWTSKVSVPVGGKGSNLRGGDGERLLIEGQPTREAAQSFYVGNRKVPTNDWIEVFMRSVEDVTRTRRRDYTVKNDDTEKKQKDSGNADVQRRGMAVAQAPSSGENSEGQSPAAEVEQQIESDLLTAVEKASIGDNRTRIVMFVDFITYTRLYKRVGDLVYRPFGYLAKEVGMRKRRQQVVKLKQQHKAVNRLRDDDPSVLGGARSGGGGGAGGATEDDDEPLIHRPLIHFVVVAFPRDEPLLRAALRSLPPEQYPTDIVAPHYLESKWAGEVRNGANNFRFALYRDWLARYVDHHHPVAADATPASVALPPAAVQSLTRLKLVVSDATDVAFQRNPFRTDATGGCFGHPDVVKASSHHVPIVIGTLENSRQTFKKEKYNRRWVKCIDDGKALERLARGYKPIACAGLTLGNGAGMYSYFTAQLLQIIRPSLVQCSLQVISAALDQATHNYLLHSLLEGRAHVAPKDVYDALGPAVGDAMFKGEGRDDAGAIDALSWFVGPPANEQLAADDKESPFYDAAAAKAHEKPPNHKPPFPVAVHLSHHEKDHCTFHGNFGKLKTIRVPIANALDGSKDSIAGSSSSFGEGGGDATTALLAVNPAGEVYDIVHQYSSDRHPPLMAALSKRYLGRGGQ